MKKNLLLLTSLYSIAIIAATAMAFNSIIVLFIEYFPSQSASTVYLLATIINIASIPVILILGPLLGNKLKYKTAFLIGLVCVSISGILSFITVENFYLLLSFRVLFGIGIGFLQFYNAALLYTFGAEKGSKYVGYSYTVSALGNIFLTNITAQVALAFGLNTTFLVYLLAIPVLLIVLLFYKEAATEPSNSEQIAQDQANDSLPSSKKNKIDSRVYFYITLGFFLFMINIPPNLNISSIIVENGVGDVSASAIVFSMMSVGSLVGGLLFGKLQSLLTRFFLPFVCLLLATGNALLVLTNSLTTFCIAFLILGVGVVLLAPMIYLYVGQITTPEKTGQVSSLVLVALNLTAVCAGFWIPFTTKLFGGNQLITPLIVGGIMSFIIGAVTLVKDIRPKESRLEQKTEIIEL